MKNKKFPKHTNEIVKLVRIFGSIKKTIRDLLLLLSEIIRLQATV